VVPVPGQEAQRFVSRPGPSGPEAALAERRAATDKFRTGRAEEARKLYPVKVGEKMIGGVRCDVIGPLTIPAEKRERVLINVHGGGFVSDSGSLVEGIPHRKPRTNHSGFCTQFGDSTDHSSRRRRVLWLRTMSVPMIQRTLCFHPSTRTCANSLQPCS
jgi:hypothetical protein